MAEYAEFRKPAGPTFVIPAGTISDREYNPGAREMVLVEDTAVVAVIELTQHELEHLTRVCGHDGFGMLPHAAQAVLDELVKGGEEAALLADMVAEQKEADRDD